MNSFIQATIQSFMALIVIAMGLQFGFKSLSDYFHLLGS